MIHNQVRNPRKESTAQLLKRPMWGVLLVEDIKQWRWYAAADAAR